MSAKLKLLSMDVGGISDAHGRTPGARSHVWLDESRSVYKRLIVSKSDIVKAVQSGCHTVAALKSETRAGTSFGGCIPLLTQMLNAELSRQGIEVNNHLYAYFPYSCQELYHLIRVEEIKTFDERLAKYSHGWSHC